LKSEAFPFVGAGRANYFEWAEVVVCFAKAPSPAQRAKIEKRVPPPLADSKDWRGRVLTVASEQGVGRVIAAAYAKKPTKPTELTTRSKFKIAPGSAYTRFDDDIDAWLRESHALSPITVAFRREDWEAGGTEKSAWHTESVAELPAILKAMARDGDAAQLALRLATYAPDAAKSLKAAWEKLEKAREAAEDRARDEKRAALDAAAEKALAPKSKTSKTLDAAGLAKACDALAKALPAFAKRLRKLGPTDAKLRPGAPAAAIAKVEKDLGVKLPTGIRALLAAFDGGKIGAITFLGTAASGARGEDEIVTFSTAGDDPEDRVTSIAVAHTGRKRRLLVPTRKPDHAWLILDNGMLEHEYRKLDGALDDVLKKKRV
jgi:hypothetical protein